MSRVRKINRTPVFTSASRGPLPRLACSVCGKLQVFYRPLFSGDLKEKAAARLRRTTESPRVRRWFYTSLILAMIAGCFVLVSGRRLIYGLGTSDLVWAVTAVVVLVFLWNYRVWRLIFPVQRR